MDRNALQDRMLDYLYDELDSSEREAYERALEGEPEVAAQVRDYQGIRQAARTVPDHEPPQAALRNLLHHARHHGVGLREIEEEENPLLHQRVRPLTGKLKGDYRVRVGGWRILVTPDRESRVLHVYAILPRGDSYRAERLSPESSLAPEMVNAIQYGRWRRSGGENRAKSPSKVANSHPCSTARAAR